MSPLLIIFALVIRPAAAHAGHGPTLAWEVCAGSALGDTCSWRNDRHDLYRGSCRSMSDALVCVRNQPIVRADQAADSRSTTAGLGLGALLIGALAWRARR